MPYRVSAAIRTSHELFLAMTTKPTNGRSRNVRTPGTAQHAHSPTLQEETSYVHIASSSVAK
jgi:hypothetical protein